MPFLHVPSVTPLLTIKKSPLHVLTRQAGLFFVPGQSGGAVNFPAGIIGDGIQFYAFSATFPLPTFRWSLQMTGEIADGWGRRSFTIRHWWRAGTMPPSVEPGVPTVQGQYYTANWNTYKLYYTGAGVPPSFIPFLRFQVFDNVGALGTVEQSLPGGISPDIWHRSVVWYDESIPEIGLQLDDLTPITATLSGTIPTGPTQGLIARDAINAPVNNWDLSFDEYGLWHDYVWTPTERDADWNLGAGTGWPDILSVISAPPMGYWRFEYPEDATPDGIASMLN